MQRPSFPHTVGSLMVAAEPVNRSIQGLRGIAVLAVLGTHAFPLLIPGGFVGVDVFFVISGYLITASLLREHERTGTISLGGFFSRRVRRLLPAATVVLVVVAAMHPLFSTIRWRENAFQVMASAGYVQNWWLATNSVDYLASEESAAPLQHFWSLSIEEQFYFVWPTLLLLGFWLRKWLRGAVLGGTVLLTVGSFVYCALSTSADPAWAYFDSVVRAWELGAGGVLAIFLHGEGRATRFAASARWLGLAGIAASLWLIRPASFFPGILALLPVGSTLLVLYSSYHGLKGGLLAGRALVFAGDVSYSLYLWHWPLLVVMRSIVGQQETPAHTLGTLGLSFVCAALSTFFVENPIRLSRTIVGWRALALVATSWLLAGLSATTILYRLDQLPEMDPAQLATAARDDLPEIYANGCHANIPSKRSKYCEYGDKQANRTIALLGDSHAAQWQPALDEIGKATSTRILSLTKSGCTVADIAAERGVTAYPECSAWRRSVLARLAKDRPDAVLVSGSNRSRPHGVEGEQEQRRALVDGFVRSLSDFEKSGVKLILIADTPRIKDIPLCLSARGATVEDCHAVVSEPSDDPLKLVSERLDVPYVTVSDLVCPNGSCPAISEGKVTWRDDHHITASYSRELSRRLRLRLSRHLDWLE